MSSRFIINGLLIAEFLARTSNSLACMRVLLAVFIAQVAEWSKQTAPPAKNNGGQKSFGFARIC